MGYQDISKRVMNVEAYADEVWRWMKENDSLLSSVSSYDSRISTLEGVSGIREIYKDALDKYADIFASDYSKGFGFFFFTDPHNGDGSVGDYAIVQGLRMIRLAFENSPAKMVLCGGDWLNTNHTVAHATRYIGRVNNLLKTEIGERCFMVTGNHDLNAEGFIDRKMTEQEVARLLYGTDDGFYSIQNPDVICYALDTGDCSDQMTPYRWSQVHWFAQKLIDNNALHSFGVVHAMRNNIGTSGNYESTLELPKNIASIASAYNSRQSITVDEHTYDFSECTGTFHFVICGHMHRDGYYSVHGIPCIEKSNGIDAYACYANWDSGKINLVSLKEEFSEDTDVIARDIIPTILEG